MPVPEDLPGHRHHGGCTSNQKLVQPVTVNRPLKIDVSLAPTIFPLAAAATPSRQHDLGSAVSAHPADDLDAVAET